MTATAILQLPCDSGHFGARAGAGPLALSETVRRLAAVHGTADVVEIAPKTPFPTETGISFELNAGLADAVDGASRRGHRIVVLAGNCDASLGGVAGLQRSMEADRLGVIWFDGHGECNTPETIPFASFDSMRLSTLTGRCWQTLATIEAGLVAALKAARLANAPAT